MAQQRNRNSPVPHLQRNTRHRLTRTAVCVVGICAVPALAAADTPPEPPKDRNCFYQLLEDTGAKIDCEHAAWLTDDEKADLAKITHDFLRDARCTIKIVIERAKVDAALAASDITFESPPQPMTCVLTTKGGDTTVTGTFAPKVVFKDGTAMSATPGLANVTGVNSYLAWPVVYYVNNAERISEPMIMMINAYRARRGEMKK